MLLLSGIIGLIVYGDRHLLVTNISIIFGSLGTIWGLIMLIYRFVYIYEAEFDTKGINVKKGKNEIFIDFINISNIEYEKPTLLNYVISYGSKLFPGILKVNLKKDEGKRKIYLIRLKYKDYEKLSNRYKDLMEYPM